MTYQSVFWSLITVLIVGRIQEAVTTCPPEEDPSSLPQTTEELMQPLLTPTNLTATQLNSTSLNISWLHPNESAESYEIKIQYMYQGPCTFSQECTVIRYSSINGSNIPQFSVTKLSAFSNYSFTIIYNVAVNRNNFSSNISASFSTLPAAPSGPPQNLTATSTTPSSITIQWGEVECLHQNSEITGYSVRYEVTTNRTLGETVTVNITGASNRTFTTTQLTPNTIYTFKVAAVSESGEGPYASIMAVTAVDSESDEDLVSTTIQSPTTTNEPETVAVFATTTHLSTRVYTTTSKDNTQNDFTIGTIVGTVIAAVVVLVAVLVLTFVLIVLCSIKQQRKRVPNVELEHEYQNPELWNEMTVAVYEELNPITNMESPATDYEITQCPAYGTTSN